MGRLVHEKGLTELLTALALARDVETQLVVAGTGPAEATLRKAAADRGLVQVHFVGPVHGADKMSLLKGAEVVVLPSYNEGLPYALLEGMAAGLAVIATPVGAIGDLIENGSNGLLVEPRSAPAIAAAIHRLASDRAALARMSAAARATIVARHSIGRLAGELCGVYRDLCARPGSRRIARV
jgi:glycosyltransferase involved in cell wall biosynthesis